MPVVFDRIRMDEVEGRDFVFPFGDKWMVLICTGGCKSKHRKGNPLAGDFLQKHIEGPGHESARAMLTNNDLNLAKRLLILGAREGKSPGRLCFTSLSWAFEVLLWTRAHSADQ